MPTDHQSPKADERRWTLNRSHPITTSLDGPRLAVGERVEVVPASLVASLQEEVDAIKDALWPWWQQQESMTAAQATERLVAEVDRLHRWKKAYAKGRAGMIASADLDHAEVERLQDRIRELEEDDRAWREEDAELTALLDRVGAPLLNAENEPIGGSLRVEAAFEHLRAEGARQERERLLALVRAQRPRCPREAAWATAVLSEEGASDGS